MHDFHVSLDIFFHSFILLLFGICLMWAAGQHWKDKEIWIRK